MHHIEIFRIEHGAEATRGVMLVDGIARFVTLELPWRGNKTDVSCIPPFDYSARKKVSAKFGNTLELLNVADRSDVLVHAGNTAADTHGCILVGTSFGNIAGAPAIVQSKAALGALMALLKEPEILVSIRDC